MSSSENDVGNRGEPHASNPASDVLRLSREAFVRKAVFEAGRYWDEMHGRNAAASVGNEGHPANKDRFTFTSSAETIDIVEISGRTHTKLVDTSHHTENPEHFAALFLNKELKGYVSGLEHVARMLSYAQRSDNEKMLVTMRPADEDDFDEVNTPEALKTVVDIAGRNIRRYR